MSFRMLPTSPLGRWSMWLLVVFVVMGLMRTFLPGVIQLSPDFTWWLLVLWPSPVVFAVGWVAGVIAWFAILRQHDRAVLTVLAAIVAALISLLVLAMFAM